MLLIQWRPDWPKCQFVNKKYRWDMWRKQCCAIFSYFWFTHLIVAPAKNLPKCADLSTFETYKKGNVFATRALTKKSHNGSKKFLLSCDVGSSMLKHKAESFISVNMQWSLLTAKEPQFPALQSLYEANLQSSQVLDLE